MGPEEGEESASRGEGQGQNEAVESRNLDAWFNAVDETDEEKPFRLPDLVECLQKGRVRCIVVTGAGISTGAGIPDFRSEGGIYATLDRYGVDKSTLSHPTQVFQLEYFKTNPAPFWAVTRELFYAADSIKPTAAHWFLRLLQDKGHLMRVYTQNIDGLEFAAGLDKDIVVQAHGGNQSAHCVALTCGQEYDVQQMEKDVRAGSIPTCEACGALVKPDVILFGEALPKRVFECLRADRDALQHPDPSQRPDLVLVMGTSLLVGPINLIPVMFRDVPRVLLNRELVGDFDEDVDCCLLGDIDTQVQRVAQLCGWADDLDALCGP